MALRVAVVFFLIGIVLSNFGKTSTRILENPRFKEPIANVTVAVGREAIMACHVEDLITYKVAWLRVDTQTILTIHSHVITKNQRIGVTHSEHKTWFLHIKEVRESDRGWYMCQINTDPMKSQVGYLDVVVSPDILDYPTSADMVVDEGADVALRCVAKGFPEPTITWKREDGLGLPNKRNKEQNSSYGPVLNITKVKREHMGPYLCIASNGVPPSVSKRIMLVVQFPPTVWIQYQLVGAYDGQLVTIECHSEAYPRSINYWTTDLGDIIPHNEKFVPEIIENGYKVHMKLTINNLGPEDYGIYRCISKNSLGEMEGTINVYRIPNPHIRNNKIVHKNIDQPRGESKYIHPAMPPGEGEADSLPLEDEQHNRSSACRNVITRALLVLWLGYVLCVKLHLPFV